MTKWKITWAGYDSDLLQSLLSKGWEPFAATTTIASGSTITTWIWLRKKEAKNEEVA